MLHSSFTELETFITNFRATAAENLGWHKPDGEHILSAIDSWIDKNRAATKIVAHPTLDAKDLVLLSRLLPTMNEPLKLTLLHISGMPERLNDPSLHDHLLTWIMKQSVMETRKLFFEVLHEIDNQISVTVEVATKACQKPVKDVPKVLPSRTYTKDSKFFFLKSEERQYCCQVQLEGTSCSRVATYHDDGLGSLMCKTHVAELMRDPKKQLFIPVDAPRVKFEEVAVEPKRCEMAVGDNMLRLTQCDKLCFRGKKGKGDDFEICADHATEIFNKNQCVDYKWQITTLTPVKCFQADLKITPLRECEKDTWRCQVVVAGYPICSDVATHNTIYGNLMCSVHAAYVTGGSFRNMSIPAGASKISWKSPKTQSRDKELVDAVGPNLVVSKSRLYCAAIDSKTGQPCSRKMVFYSSTNGTSVGFCSLHLPLSYSTNN